MPNPEKELLDILRSHGVDFTGSLPCEKFKDLLTLVGRSFQHVPLTREEEGVGICAGAALAGRRPALFVQSSGIGNMINALLSLTQFYELPLALFVSRRGVYKEKIAAQLPMGQRLPGILAAAGIAHSMISAPSDFPLIDRDLRSVYENSRIHAFLLSPAIWERSECSIHGSEFKVQDSEGACRSKDAESADLENPNMTRYEVIEHLSSFLAGKVVVSNLGWPSKELYAVRHQPSNFYMLGSMGMVLPLGIGIALNTKKDVIVIDGDGSLLMNPGSLATAASTAPKNLTIVAIDNNVYGSTGNQPTLARTCVDLAQIARGFGFRNTIKVTTADELSNALKRRPEGPLFIHVLAVAGNKDVPNIPVHHLEIKKQVQEFLKG